MHHTPSHTHADTHTHAYTQTHAHPKRMHTHANTCTHACMHTQEEKREHRNKPWTVHAEMGLGCTERCGLSGEVRQDCVKPLRSCPHDQKCRQAMRSVYNSSTRWETITTGILVARAGLRAGIKHGQFLGHITNLLNDMATVKNGKVSIEFKIGTVSVCVWAWWYVCTNSRASSAHYSSALTRAGLAMRQTHTQNTTHTQLVLRCICHNTPTSAQGVVFAQCLEQVHTCVCACMYMHVSERLN